MEIKVLTLLKYAAEEIYFASLPGLVKSGLSVPWPQQSDAEGLHRVKGTILKAVLIDGVNSRPNIYTFHSISPRRLANPVYS